LLIPFRRRRRQQINKHLVELLDIQIDLYLNWPDFKLGFVALRPGKRIAIVRAVVDRHIYESRFLLFNQARIEPCRRGQLIPQVVIFAMQAGILPLVTCCRLIAGLDPF